MNATRELMSSSTRLDLLDRVSELGGQVELDSLPTRLASNTMCRLLKHLNREVRSMPGMCDENKFRVDINSIKRYTNLNYIIAWPCRQIFVPSPNVRRTLGLAESLCELQLWTEIYVLDYSTPHERRIDCSPSDVILTGASH